MAGPLVKSPQNKGVSKDSIPKVWGKGPVRIHDVDLDCYVLQDGTPVLNKGKMMKAIGRQWKGTSRTDMPNFIGAINLQPFIRPELEEKLKGIEFLDGRKQISGYHAEILPMVCEVYLEAREAGALTKPQQPMAQACETLMRAFARVGITALIYEQLGFEKYKHPQALRLLIESYLAEEVRRWAKEFPDELFYQMDRLYGNVRTTSNKRPQYYAHFIRKYIYDPIEKGGVLLRLDQRNPVIDKKGRKDRHHQLLNEEKGLPELRSQIWQVIALLKTSANKMHYERNWQRLIGQSWQTEIFEN